jgi:hypothetical protein
MSPVAEAIHRACRSLPRRSKTIDPQIPQMTQMKRQEDR